MVFDNGREVFFSLMNSSTPLRLRSGQAAQGRQETKKSRLTKIIRLPLASLVGGDKISLFPAQNFSIKIFM
jgi:hypothetical protein